MKRFRKLFVGLMSVLLVAAFCFSSTLAWQSLDQTARNDVWVEYTGGDRPTPSSLPTPSGSPDRPDPPGPDDPDPPRPPKPTPTETLPADATPTPTETMPAGVTPTPTATVPAGVTPTPEGSTPPTPDSSASPEPSGAPIPGQTPTASPEPSNAPIPGPTPTPSTDVKTGDTGELTFWLVILVTGLVGMAVCVACLVYSRRRYTGKRLTRR